MNGQVVNLFFCTLDFFSVPFLDECILLALCNRLCRFLFCPSEYILNTNTEIQHLTVCLPDFVS